MGPCNQAIAALGDGFDESRRPRIVGQRLAEIGNGVGQSRVGDEFDGPYGVDKIPARHDFTGVVRETHEHFHGFRLEVDRNLAVGNPVELRAPRSSHRD